jgi:hypothetical protein
MKAKQIQIMKMAQIKPKPPAAIIGANGNIYNLLAIARKALKSVGQREEADVMMTRVTQSGSYDKALQIIMEYVEPVEVGN